VALGLLALEFASCFSFVWRGDVWRWVCGVSFLWVEYFWCESRISLGAIYEFRFGGVGLLPLSLRDGAAIVFHRLNASMIKQKKRSRRG